MKEKWKTIVDFPGYEVSDRGQIRSAKTGRIRKQIAGKTGQGVTLRHNGKTVTRGVARLVAQEFIPNPEDLDRVTHKNGDQTDNRASNLRWCSNSEVTIIGHSRRQKKEKV